LLLLVLLLWAAPGQATVFWTEGFENHLYQNWVSSGVFLDSVNNPDGINATISTDSFAGWPTSGAHSLKSVFTSSCQSTGCGDFYDRSIPDSQEVWFRTYYYTTNFTYYALTVTKFLILVPNGNGNQFYFSNDNGDRRMSVAVGNNNNYQVQTCPNGVVDVGCSYPPNLASVSLDDNQVYCIEGHIINNTVGQSNGTVELFVNGTQTVGYYNQQTQNVNSQTNVMRHYVQNGLGNRYIDDLSVGNTRLGCGSASPPPSDTTPPAAVTGLAVSANGAGQATITFNLTTDTGGSGLAGTILKRCTGAACTPSTVLTQVAAPGTSSVDSSLTGGTTYGYAAAGVDNAGNIGTYTAAVYVTTPSTFRTTLDSDNFQRVNAADLGAKWNNGYTNRSAAQIVSQTIEPTTVNTEAVEQFQASVATPNDQWCQITINVFTGAQAAETGCVLRMADPPTITWALCIAQHNEGTTTLINTRVADVSKTSLTENATTWANGDKLRCEFEGTALRLYRIPAGTSTEILVLSGSDANVTTGKTGIDDWVATSGSLANVSNSLFVMGGFSSSPPAAPTITTLTFADDTGFTETDTGSPASYRLQYGDNAGTFNQSIVIQAASIVAGRYNIVLPAGTDFACLFARDSAGVENDTANAYVCANPPDPAVIDHGPSTGVLRQLGSKPWLTNDSGNALYLSGLSGIFTTVMDYSESGLTGVIYDYATKFAQMVSQGLNFIRNFTFEESASGTAGFEEVPYTQLPYVAISTRVDGGTGKTVGIFDLTQINPAFLARERAVVLAAVKAGLTPSVMLWYGYDHYQNTVGGMSHPYFASNNVNGISCDANANNMCEETHENSNAAITALQDALVKARIDNLNDIDGYLYEISNEDKDDATNIAWQNHIADTVKNYEATGGRKIHPIWNTGMAFTQNNAGLLTNTHVTLISTICDGVTNYETNPPAATGAKVILYDSDHTGAGSVCGTETVAVKWKLFTRGYHDVSLNLRESAGVQANLITTAAGVQVYAKKMHLAGMLPVTDSTIINSGYGLKEDCSEYLMYMPADGSNTINLGSCSAGLAFTVEFFDPITNVTSTSANVAGGGTRSFNPTGTDPMVVYLKVNPLIDITPPTVFGGLPTGVQPIGTTSVTLQVSTSEAATCKYGPSDVAYASLPSTFSTTGGTTHTQTLSGETAGASYTEHVLCQDPSGNISTPSTTVTWSIGQQADLIAPVMTNTSSLNPFPAGTTAAPFSLSTNEAASCKWDTTDVAYASMANTMTAAALNFSATATSLTNGSTHTYYARCQDVAQPVPNTDTVSLVITVVVASSTADTTAPSTVAGLTGSVVSQTQGLLAWTAATDNVAVAGYRIYLSTDGCVTPVFYGLVGNTTLALINLAGSTTYCAEVKAIDTSNNLSAAYSNTVTIVTPGPIDITPPSTMTNLRVVGTFSNSVVLTSDPGTDDRGSVTTTIELSPSGCSNFTLVYSNLSLLALIQGLAPNTAYCARGKFVDQSSNASVAYSNTVTFTTASTGLSLPRTVVPFSQPRTSAGTRTPVGTRSPRQ